MPEKIEITAQSTDATLTDARLVYSKDGRTRRIGEAAMAKTSNYATGNCRIFNGALSLDFLSEGELTDYSVEINMVRSHMQSLVINIIN